MICSRLPIALISQWVWLKYLFRNNYIKEQDKVILKRNKKTRNQVKINGLVTGFFIVKTKGRIHLINFILSIVPFWDNDFDIMLLHNQKE